MLVLRARWRALIKRVYELHPWLRLSSHVATRILRFIIDHEAIYPILRPLAPKAAARDRAPPD